MSDDKPEELPVITAVGIIKMPSSTPSLPPAPEGKEVADGNPTVDSTPER
jgi:hypothetical protein